MFFRQSNSSSIQPRENVLQSSHWSPSALASLSKRTRGVLPMCSRIEARILGSGTLQWPHTIQKEEEEEKNREQSALLQRIHQILKKGQQACRLDVFPSEKEKKEKD